MGIEISAIIIKITAKIIITILRGMRNFVRNHPIKARTAKATKRIKI